MSLMVQVVEISSADKFNDKKRRVTIRVLAADQMFSEFCIKESALGFGELHLDDVFEVEFTPQGAAHGS